MRTKSAEHYRTDYLQRSDLLVHNVFSKQHHVVCGRLNERGPGRLCIKAFGNFNYCDAFIVYIHGT